MHKSFHHRAPASLPTAVAGATSDGGATDALAEAARVRGLAPKPGQPPPGTPGEAHLPTTTGAVTLASAPRERRTAHVRTKCTYDGGLLSRCRSRGRGLVRAWECMRAPFKGRAPVICLRRSQKTLNITDPSICRPPARNSWDYSRDPPRPGSEIVLPYTWRTPHVL